MQSVTLILILLVLLSVHAVSCSISAPSHTVQSPTGSHFIPKALLQQRLRIPDASEEDLKKRLFEISEDGFMTGPNVATDLHADAKPIRTDESTDSFTLNVNGKDRPKKGVFPTVHEAGGYQFLHDDKGKIVAVWGEDVFLEPLDRVKYPGVFINNQEKAISMANDYVTPDGEVDSEVAANTTSGDDPPTSDRQLSGCRVVDVAVAFDNYLCLRLGNSVGRTVSYVRSVVNYASYILRRDTCHRLRLVRIDANCRNPRDPYNYLPVLRRLSPSQRPAYILNRFRFFWLVYRRFVPRDVAYFFSGFTEGTSVAGRAFVAAACTSYGFGWAELGYRPIFVHEIGHTLGALHTTSGIMKSSFTGQSVVFSAVSKAQINAFLRNPRSRCIGN